MNNLGTKELETRRLLLRKVNINDVDDLFYNWGSDKKTTKYLTFKTHETEAQTLELINNWLKKYEQGGYEWVIELKDNHQVIGAVSGCVSFRYDCMEIGYSICSKYFNQGIMTEALKTIINYFLVDCECNAVKAIIPSNNIASIRVACKVGMTYELTSEDQYKDKDGNVNDLLIYSIYRK